MLLVYQKSKQSTHAQELQKTKAHGRCPGYFLLSCSPFWPNSMTETASYKYVKFKNNKPSSIACGHGPVMLISGRFSMLSRFPTGPTNPFGIFRVGLPELPQGHVTGRAPVEPHLWGHPPRVQEVQVPARPQQFLWRGVQILDWLVISPPLKNMNVNLDDELPIISGKIKVLFQTTTQWKDTEVRSLSC